MSEDGTGLRGLWWEWVAARVVLVLGFGVPLALYLALLFLKPSAPPVESSAGEEAGAQQQQDTQGRQFCAAAISVAQSFGILPSFAKPTSTPQESDVQGRYVCTAATDAAKYQIAVNFLCKAVNDPHCYQLYSVTADDGTVLYQRQE